MCTWISACSQLCTLHHNQPLNVVTDWEEAGRSLGPGATSLCCPSSSHWPTTFYLHRGMDAIPMPFVTSVSPLTYPPQRAPKLKHISIIYIILLSNNILSCRHTCFIYLFEIWWLLEWFSFSTIMSPIALNIGFIPIFLLLCNTWRCMPYKKTGLFNS